MVEDVVRPSGPYSLRLSGRFGTDATRSMRDGVLTATIPCAAGLEQARAWQRPDGAVCIQAAGEESLVRMRFILAVNDDHSEFLRRFADDPLVGRATRHLRGMRQSTHVERIDQPAAANAAAPAAECDPVSSTAPSADADGRQDSG